MYVFIVDLPAFAGSLDARPAARAVRVGVRVDRLELGPERTEARHDRAHALLPVAQLADAEHPLDVVVVRGEVETENGVLPSLVRPLAGCHFATSRSCARKATFVLIVVVPPTQRAARKVTSSPFSSGAKRSGQKRSWAAFA